MTRTRWRGVAEAALGAALAVALTGCSGDDPAPSTSSAESSTTASAEDSATASGESSATAPSSDGSASAAPTSAAALAPDKAIIGKNFTVRGTYVPSKLTMRLDLVELKRRGELLQLVAHLTNTSTDQSQDLRWQVGSRFNPGTYREDLTTTSGAFAGVVLTDVAAKKRYLVAADSARDCVCTINLSGTFVAPGDTVELTATYAAPPPTTRQLDVEVPLLGVFRDVPVT